MNTQILNEKDRVTELVLEAQRGSQEAVGELFQRFEKHVYAIALRRSRDHNDALELTQDVFVQVIEKIGQLRQPECFAGWLRTITNRLAINRGMRKGPEFSSEPEALEAIGTTKAGPLEQAIESERQDRVREGLDQLRDMDRETLEAFYVGGRSLIEMSDDFSAPVGTIKRRLHVARKRLAKHVEELVAI